MRAQDVRRNDKREIRLKTLTILGVFAILQFQFSWASSLGSGVNSYDIVTNFSLSGKVVYFRDIFNLKFETSASYVYSNDSPIYGIWISWPTNLSAFSRFSNTWKKIEKESFCGSNFYGLVEGKGRVLTGRSVETNSHGVIRRDGRGHLSGWGYEIDLSEISNLTVYSNSDRSLLPK